MSQILCTNSNLNMYILLNEFVHINCEPYAMVLNRYFEFVQITNLICTYNFFLQYLLTIVAN